MGDLCTGGAGQGRCGVGQLAVEGVLAGAAGTTITIKPAAKPSGNTRITATVDSDGNRTALTLKVPD